MVALASSYGFRRFQNPSLRRTRFDDGETRR